MGWQKFKIVGFAPDLEPTTPGILTKSIACAPTDRGIGSSGWYAVKEQGFIADASLGGAVLTKVDGTQRVFAGFGTQLAEISGTSVTDRSGSTYAATATDTWSFAQFGDVTLAVNKQNNLQQINAGADFAAVSGAPKASIVITPSLPNAQFAMCFDYNDGTNDYLDGISWSALGDYTSWTPSISTEAGNVRLTDIGGPFTAAIPYKDGVVAFKARAMYLGEYVGGSAIWSWQRISADIGCIGKNAVVEANDVLYFADAYGFWMYDGSYPRPMPGFLHNWWAASYGNVTAKSTTNFNRMTWDKTRHRLWFSFTGGDGLPANYVAFNTRSNIWTEHGTFSAGTSGPWVSELLDGAYALGSDSSGTNGIWMTMAWTAAAVQAEVWFHVAGDITQISRMDGVRPVWLSGGADSSTTWCELAIQTGPTIHTVTSNASYDNVLTVEANGIFHNSIAARFLRPIVAIPTISQIWEFGSVAMKIDFAGNN